MTQEDEKLIREIRELLIEIPDAYEDFVRYAPIDAYFEGLAIELLEYLKSNKRLTSSDILNWIIEKAGWEEGQPTDNRQNNVDLMSEKRP